jgi:PAS domain S-box-containing protein
MRELLRADGVHFWRVNSSGELVGAEADGAMADQFAGTLLKSQDFVFLSDVVHFHKTLCLNHLPAQFKLAQFPARSLMAAPVIAANRLLGIVTILHLSDPGFFSEDIAAKAAILTAQLATIVEAPSQPALPLANPPRNAIIEGAARTATLPDYQALLDALADRLRGLLRTRLVCVLQKNGRRFVLQAVAAESPQQAAAARAQHGDRTLQFAADLAQRALTAGEPITVSIDPATYALGELVPPGTLMVAPFRTSQTQGAVLIYPRVEGGFSEAEKSLAAAMTGFTATALAHAELQAAAHLQAEELEQLLGLVAELNSSEPLEGMMQRLSVRAAAFLGFQRSCVGVREEGSFHFRWKSEAGQTAPLDWRLPTQTIIGRTLLNKDVFWTDDIAATASDLRRTPDFEFRQMLAVPLLARDGSTLGAVAVLDRNDGAGISPEDIRRAKLLATHVASAMDRFHLFARMEQANRHWIEIFDAITDFIVVHDEGNKVARINRALADFIGVPPPALIGVEMSALFGAAEPARVRDCPFCRGTENAAGEHIHSILEHTYRVSSSRTANRGGWQTIHVLQDVTDSYETESRYRELFGNIQEGLFFAAPDGRFVEVNDALVGMLGYASREELLQTDIRTQVYASQERYRLFAEKMQQQGGVKNHEETLTRKDGAPVYVLINGFAVRDPRGAIVQYRGLMLDISGLKSFQSELQRERDFSGKILSHTQSLILVADSSGLISYANRRWFDMGYEQRHLLGLPLQELVSPSRRVQLEAALAATLEGKPVDNLDLQILRGDGSIGQFSVNMSPMRDDQGHVTSVVVMMTDVSDATILQAKLMHAEKMAAVGQLVSGVAHEVNNPLTAILGFADLLLENNDLPEIVRRDLRVILQEAQRTKQIVQNLLSFARQMPPQRSPVQLNTILRRTLQLRAYDFHSHGIEVTEQLDESLPDVVGDPQQLQQVFLNIVNNAYDAVRETGRQARIDIMTARRGQFVEVWFCDNGHGISHPERIFDPFFTTKEVGKGTGLGLSICYGIVREHGGEILCHNNADRPGATFVVRLPSASEAVTKSAIVGVSQL